MQDKTPPGAEDRAAGLAGAQSTPPPVASQDLHEGVLSAAAVNAANLTRLRSREAIAVYQHIVRAHRTQGRTSEAITAMMTLAECRHTCGDCGDALRAGAQAWNDWRHSYGTRHAGGIPVAIPLVAMFAACGRVIEAHRVLGQVGPALPPVGSVDRAVTAAWATTLINGTVEQHRQICAGRLDAVYGLDHRADLSRTSRPSPTDWSDFLT